MSPATRPPAATLETDPNPAQTLSICKAAGLTLSAPDWPNLSISPADKLTPELRQLIATDKWAIMAHLLEARLTEGLSRLLRLEARGMSGKAGHVHQLARFEVLDNCYQAAWQAATDPEYRVRLEGYHAKFASEVAA